MNLVWTWTSNNVHAPNHDTWTSNDIRLSCCPQTTRYEAWTNCDIWTSYNSDHQLWNLKTVYDMCTSCNLRITSYESWTSNGIWITYDVHTTSYEAWRPSAWHKQTRKTTHRTREFLVLFLSKLFFSPEGGVEGSDEGSREGGGKGGEEKVLQWEACHTLEGEAERARRHYRRSSGCGWGVYPLEVSSWGVVLRCPLEYRSERTSIHTFLPRHTLLSHYECEPTFSRAFYCHQKAPELIPVELSCYEIPTWFLQKGTVIVRTDLCETEQLQSAITYSCITELSCTTELSPSVELKVSTALIPRELSSVSKGFCCDGLLRKNLVAPVYPQETE